MAERGFDFHVGGIEDGMLTVLRAELRYLNTFGKYSGQLNREGLRETVKAALNSLVKGAPCVLVCYTGGADEDYTASGVLYGEPREYRHRAAFVVIVVDSDARGQEAQRRGTALRPGGVYRMIDDVRDALSGAQFEREVEGGESGEKVIVNDDPLEPAGVEYIDRLPNATAYACHFLTSFTWRTRERRPDPVRVEEIVFDIAVTNAEGGPGGMPGVHFTGQQP